MKPFKHTPGPWKIKHQLQQVGGTKNHEFEIWHQSKHITTIFEHVNGLQKDKANAALIAAAPDMLAILEKTVQFFESNGGHKAYTFLPEMHAIIAKAKGVL